MTNPTCNGCPDRKPGCHDQCERFKAWQQPHKAELDYVYDMTHTMSGAKSAIWAQMKETNENRTGNYGGEQLFGEH